jgi:hypothetical protein
MVRTIAMNIFEGCDWESVIPGMYSCCCWFFASCYFIISPEKIMSFWTAVQAVFQPFFWSPFSLVSFLSSFIFLDIASILVESSHCYHSCWGCCGSWSLAKTFLLKVREHVCSCHDWTFQSSNLSSDIHVILGFSLICFLSADMISEGTSVTFSLGCYLFECSSGWLTLQVMERFYEVSKRMQTDFLFQDYIYLGSILDLEVALKLHEA